MQVTREVVNEDIKENQIRIKITASNQLEAVDASYIKYHLRYDDGKHDEFENHFYTNEKEKVFFHNFPQGNLPSILKTLKEKEI